MINIFYKQKNELTSIAMEKCTLRRDRNGNRLARMRFAIKLDAALAMSSPPAIRAAFEAAGVLDNKIVVVESAMEIDGIGIEFYSLPQKMNCSLALPSVSLFDFSIENQGGQLFMFFSLTLELDENINLRHWILDNIFIELWAEFTVQQMVLLPQSHGRADAEAVQ